MSAETIDALGAVTQTIQRAQNEVATTAAALAKVGADDPERHRQIYEERLWMAKRRLDQALEAYHAMTGQDYRG